MNYDIFAQCGNTLTDTPNHIYNYGLVTLEKLRFYICHVGHHSNLILNYSLQIEAYVEAVVSSKRIHMRNMWHNVSK